MTAAMRPSTGSAANPYGWYGLLAEFEGPSEVKRAAERARLDGYTRMDAYAPFPVEGLTDALGKRPTRLPYITLICGIIGGLTGYLLQYYSAVIDYPLNVGGRPLHSWPSFMPVTFELTVLFAAFGSVLGMFAINRLPKPYHPLFNAPAFLRASQDRFFLCIEAVDPKFDHDGTRQYLESLDPIDVHTVEP